MAKNWSVAAVLKPTKQRPLSSYYTAIASALVFHSHKITQHSYEKLNQAYTELEQKPWIQSELMGLFRRALALCQQQKGKKS